MDQFTDVPVVAWAVVAGVTSLLFLTFTLRAFARLRRSYEFHTEPARVVTKRAATHGHISPGRGNQVYTSYFATFEMASGERLEFHLHDSAYGMLVEGDEGTLTYQGTRWHGFERGRQGKGAGRRRATARSRRP